METENLHIAALRQGSKEAFTALYNKYWNQVFNFSKLYIKGNDVAEEVVQEVFTKLWEAREMISEKDNFKGLLFIITRNLVFNKHRKRLNEDFYKITVLTAIESSYDIEGEIEAKQLSEYIDQLIAELPPRRREIFILSRKEHKTYSEIAELLQISEKTVENQIHEALKYLRHNIPLLIIFLSMN